MQGLRLPPAFAPVPPSFVGRVFSWLYTRLVVFFFIKTVKFVIHLVTGTSEIERICSTATKSNIRAFHLLVAIKFSAKLTAIQTLLQQPILQPDAIADQLIAAKRVALKAQPSLRAAFLPVQALDKFKSTMYAAMQTPYQSDNTGHEQMLETLWQVLKPNIRRAGGRLTKEWEEIGFQGKDPATDFRGMGLLGLQDLLVFAQTRTPQANEMLSIPDFPLAIVGIKISALLVQWIQSRELDGHFLTKGAERNVWHDLYADIFIKFAAYYKQNPPKDLMHFPPVWHQFCTNLQKTLCI